MKAKVLFIATVITLLTAACKDEKELMDGRLVTNREVKFTDAELNVLYRMRNENNRVSMEEATCLANDVIGFLDGDSGVKSTGRSISSIGALTSENLQTAALKSSNGINVEIPDTVAYVFNFGENEGFAIISADTRIEAPILGYTGSGTLGTETDNPGLGIFLEGAEDYILRSIADSEHKRDSLIGIIMAKLNPENKSETKSMIDVSETYKIRVTSVTDTKTTAQLSPLLPVEWGQEDPFNRDIPKSCPKNDGGKAPTGCVATAIAQIMAYWKYPASVDGVAMNWTELTKYTSFPNAYDNVRGKISIDNSSATFRNQVTYLMERIGKHTKMNYGCDGSGTTPSDAIIFLNKLGYKVAVWPTAYNYNTTLLMLKSRIPVAIGGYSSRTSNKFLGINIYYTYDGGHRWVIDGYLDQTQSVTITAELIDKLTGKVLDRATSSSINSFSYLHNNWGLDGLANGYFLAGVFDMFSIERLDSNTKSAGNYQYENSIFAVYR